MEHVWALSTHTQPSTTTNTHAHAHAAPRLQSLPPLKWSDPDEAGLVDFLVGRMNFSEDRVRKTVGRIKGAKGKVRAAAAGRCVWGGGMCAVWEHCSSHGRTRAKPSARTPALFLSYCVQVPATSTPADLALIPGQPLKGTRAPAPHAAQAQQGRMESFFKPLPNQPPKPAKKPEASGMGCLLASLPPCLRCRLQQSQGGVCVRVGGWVGGGGVFVQVGEGQDADLAGSGELALLSFIRGAC